MENQARKENGNCRQNSNIWHAGTNTVNASVKADALSAMRKAYGGHSCGGDDGLSGAGYPGRD